MPDVTNSRARYSGAGFHKIIGDSLATLAGHLPPGRNFLIIGKWAFDEFQVPAIINELKEQVRQ